jgi:hypothetical protein
MEDLPARAFDSAEQRQTTAALLDDYNVNQDLTPAIDARFEALARQRTTTHPLRTWLLMPLGRLADMALRPRVENLTIDLRWWEYSKHRSETRFSVVYGFVNLLYLSLGILGLCLRPRCALPAALRCSGFSRVGRENYSNAFHNASDWF